MLVAWLTAVGLFASDPIPPVIAWPAKATTPASKPHPLPWTEPPPASQCLDLVTPLWWNNPERPDPHPALYDPPSREESEIVERQVRACARAPAWLDVDWWGVLILGRLERQAGAPEGLLVATYCWEVGLRDRAVNGGPHRGDWMKPDDAGQGLGYFRAHGPTQSHRWLSDWCDGIDRDAFVPAFACYLRRVMAMRNEAARRCGDEAAWRVAEAVTANFRRYGWRCGSKSRHWGVMEAMQ